MATGRPQRVMLDCEIFPHTGRVQAGGREGSLAVAEDSTTLLQSFAKGSEED